MGKLSINPLDPSGSMTDSCDTDCVVSDTSQIHLKHGHGRSSKDGLSWVCIQNLCDT